MTSPQQHEPIESAAWDSMPWRELRNEKLLEWFCGNEDAVRLYVTISSIAETWDDLIDKDRVVSPELINEAFIGAIFGLNENHLFAQHRERFLSLFMVMVNAWLDSAEMEQGNSRHERMWAFFLRNYGFDFGAYIAYLCGGFGHMRKVSLELRRFFTHETYETWEHRHAA